MVFVGRERPCPQRSRPKRRKPEGAVFGGKKVRFGIKKVRLMVKNPCVRPPHKFKKLFNTEQTWRFNQ
jgi:hypothetical protein